MLPTMAMEINIHYLPLGVNRYIVPKVFNLTFLVKKTIQILTLGGRVK